MKFQFSLYVFIFLFTKSFAQIAVKADIVNGQPLTSKNSTDITGTPFLFEDWKTANVSLVSGIKWKPIPLKIDLYSNKIIFKDENNTEKSIIEPIQSIVFEDNDLPDIWIINKEIFEVLDKSGKNVFLRKTQKYIQETNEYSSSRTTKKFASNTDYYIQNKELTKVKLNISSFEMAFPNYKKQINEFTKNKKLKSSEDFKLLIQKINLLDR